MGPWLVQGCGGESHRQHTDIVSEVVYTLITKAFQSQYRHLIFPSRWNTVHLKPKLSVVPVFCIHRWNVNKCEDKISATFWQMQLSQWKPKVRSDIKWKKWMPNGKNSWPLSPPRLSWSWLVYNLSLDETQRSEFDLFCRPTHGLWYK